jgi:hypothetical protein
MAAPLIVLFAITAVSGILVVGFLAACWRIRRTDRSTLRPQAPALHRRHMLAYASHRDDNNPAYV